MRPVIAVPATAALVYRAYSRKSLTPIGLLAAFVTAVVHALHPWSVFFALLAVFFLAGSTATKVCSFEESCRRHLTQGQVKHDIKVKLTQSATGASGGEGTRNHVQVIANSGVASVLILLHLWQLRKEGRYGDQGLCWHRGSDALMIGIVA